MGVSPSRGAYITHHTRPANNAANRTFKVTSTRPHNPNQESVKTIDVSDVSCDINGNTLQNYPRDCVRAYDARTPALFTQSESRSKNQRGTPELHHNAQRVLPELASRVATRMSLALHPRDKATSTPDMVQRSTMSINKIVSTMVRRFLFQVDELVAWEMLVERLADHDELRKGNGFTSIVFACAFIAMKHISDDYIGMDAFTQAAGISYDQMKYTEQVVFNVLLNTVDANGRCNLVLTTSDISSRIETILEEDIFDVVPSLESDIEMGDCETQENRHAKVMKKALSTDSFFPLHDNRMRTPLSTSGRAYSYDCIS